MHYKRQHHRSALLTWTSTVEVVPVAVIAHADVLSCVSSEVIRLTLTEPVTVLGISVAPTQSVTGQHLELYVASNVGEVLDLAGIDLCKDIKMIEKC